MKRGKFILFEGPDGCGKSSVLELIKKELDRNAVSYISSREPGGSPSGEKIRAILLDKNNYIEAKTEALLMAASRAQLVEETIERSLREGTNVLLDRYTISSLVYQGYVRGLGIEEVYKINEFATNSLKPDLTLYFDLSYETALSRRNFRGVKDRLEEEGEKFHQKVHEGYKLVYNNYKEVYNMEKIDASLSLEAVFDEAFAKLKEILEV